jgi:hypothetical protein
MGQAYSNYINSGGGAGGVSPQGGAGKIDHDNQVQEQQEKAQAKYESQTPNPTASNEQGQGAFDTSMNRYDFMGGLQPPHF